MQKYLGRHVAFLSGMYSGVEPLGQIVIMFNILRQHLFLKHSSSRKWFLPLKIIKRIIPYCNTQKWHRAPIQGIQSCSLPGYYLWMLFIAVAALTSMMEVNGLQSQKCSFCRKRLVNPRNYVLMLLLALLFVPQFGLKFIM